MPTTDPQTDDDSGSVTKRDLIDELVARFPRFSRRDAEVMVNEVFEGLAESLRRGERIEIRGFGSFVVRHRQARTGRNPRTGRRVEVEAKRVPFFKVGKELRERVDLEEDGAEDLDASGGLGGLGGPGGRDDD